MKSRTHPPGSFTCARADWLLQLFFSCLLVVKCAVHGSKLNKMVCINIGKNCRMRIYSVCLYHNFVLICDPVYQILLET